MIIPSSVFSLLVYTALGLSLTSIVILIYLFFRDIKKDKLW